MTPYLLKFFVYILQERSITNAIKFDIDWRKEDQKSEELGSSMSCMFQVLIFYFLCLSWYHFTSFVNYLYMCRVTTNMEKKFCPNCGNATLIRTSASTDANGNVTYYLKKNFQYNLRGTKVYSMLVICLRKVPTD